MANRDPFDEIVTEDFIKDQAAPDPEETAAPVEPSGSEGSPAEAVEEESAEGESVPAPVEEKPKPDWKLDQIELPDGTKSEIPLDAKITYKMNGQTVVATVQELKNKASGVDNLDRVYSKFKREQDAFYAHVDKFRAEVNKGNAVGALIDAVSARGEDPVKFLDNFKKQVLGFANHYASLTPEQRQLMDAHDVNKFYRSKAEREAEARKSLEFSQEAQQKQLDVERRYSLPPGAFEEHFQILQKLQAEGSIAQGIIEPEVVGIFYYNLLEQDAQAQRETQLESIVSKVDPALVSDKDVRESVEFALKDGVEEADIIRILKEQFKAEEPKTETPTSDRAARAIQAPKPASKAEKETTRVRRSAQEVWDEI